MGKNACSDFRQSKTEHFRSDFRCTKSQPFSPVFGQNFMSEIQITKLGMKSYTVLYIIFFFLYRLVLSKIQTILSHFEHYFLSEIQMKVTVSEIRIIGHPNHLALSEILTLSDFGALLY